MAFTEFACRNGGSNLNAGTRTGNSTEPGTSADFTYASGTWVASTGVFTVASGDPASDGVAVGDFASVYPDGSSVAVFIGRVTARNSTTITVSLTAKAGTAPTDGTGDRTLKVGGAWAGPSGTSGFPLTFVGAALTNSAGDLPRINLKGGTTYSITASIAPTTAQNSVTIQGYTTAYGDKGKATIDGGTSGASYVLFAPVTNKLHTVDVIFCNNGATGNAHGVTPSANCMFTRCVFHSLRGIGLFGGHAIGCEAYACNASNTSGWAGFLGNSINERCKSHSHVGSNANGFATVTTAIDCISANNGGSGFLAFSGAARILSCDAYDNAGDGINIPSNASMVISIANCNLVANGGYGINGAGNPCGVINNCGFGSGTKANTSGAMNGVGSMLVEDSVTYPADVTPWNDPDNGDFSITLAEAKNAGHGDFTETASGYSGTVGYPDIGAAQHLDAGGGGGLALNPIGSSFIRGL